MGMRSQDCDASLSGIWRASKGAASESVLQHHALCSHHHTCNSAMTMIVKETHLLCGISLLPLRNDLQQYQLVADERDAARPLNAIVFAHGLPHGPTVEVDLPLGSMLAWHVGLCNDARPELIDEVELPTVHSTEQTVRKIHLFNW